MFQAEFETPNFVTALFVFFGIRGPGGFAERLQSDVSHGAGCCLMVLCVQAESFRLRCWLQVLRMGAIDWADLSAQLGETSPSVAREPRVFCARRK